MSSRLNKFGDLRRKLQMFGLITPKDFVWIYWNLPGKTYPGLRWGKACFTSGCLEVEQFSEM